MQTLAFKSIHGQTQRGCVQELDAAFTPGKGQLTRLFLYVLDPSQHARPPSIPEAQWQFALRKAGGPNNAARLWPVAVHGAEQLKAHRDAQQKGAEANRAYLSQLHSVVQKLAATEEHDMRRRAAQVLRTHAEQAHRLLKVRFQLSDHAIDARRRFFCKD